MTDRLIVRLGETIVGNIEQTRNELRLTYEDAWRQSPASYPLSLSMPLVQAEHQDEVVRPWLEGLLPDSEVVLRSWAREFGASARNPFSLLSHVGEDLPGAVQLLRPDRVDTVAGRGGTVRWLTEEELEERLRGLVDNHAAWRVQGDTGYFSLAGAQPKTALLFDEGRWGVPSGSIPTTHVFKPPAAEGLDGLAENEHLCLGIAGALGIPAADSAVARFGDQSCLVVQRCDRLRVGGVLRRIHQEDCCQALGISPLGKYEAEGGPGASSIIQLLRDQSSAPRADIEHFVAALALNWAIGGSDGHAKNFSVLIAPGGQVRLAPIYDVLTVLPYPRRYHPPEVKLAMKIGGEYRLDWIARRHWARFAEEASLGASQVLSQVEDVVERLAHVIPAVCAQGRGEGLSMPFVDRFEEALLANVARASSTLGRPS